MVDRLEASRAGRIRLRSATQKLTHTRNLIRKLEDRVSKIDFTKKLVLRFTDLAADIKPHIFHQDP